jgi:outer membrane lipoprotein-sorting protein
MYEVAMKARNRFGALVFTIFLAQTATAALADPAAEPAAQDIVARSDKVRNPEQSFRTTTTLTEYVSGQERDHDSLIVLSKRDAVTQQFRNLVQYVDPPRDAGKRVLLDGRSLWFYDPSSKASVRISPQQRLIGQAAIGDVLTVNLAIDYKAALLGSEAIQDSTRQEHQCWHLDLAAATDQAVYHRVEYWVEKGTYYPIKGKFYSDSGRVLKIIYFGDFSQSLGALRPDQAIIIDAVDTSLVTVASSKDQRFQDVPDAWFGRDYLPRLDNQ